MIIDSFLPKSLIFKFIDIKHLFLIGLYQNLICEKMCAVVDACVESFGKLFLFFGND